MVRKLVVFALVVFLLVPSASLWAEEQGRPDPTGQGRYLQFGAEVPRAGARVVKELPAGAECAPAGEMVGARVWNSTRDGYAILSELSAKAEIAISGDHVFLCHCARGYNELFRVETAPPASPPTTTTQPPVPAIPAPATTVQQVMNIETPLVSQAPFVTQSTHRRRWPWILAGVAVGIATGGVLAGPACLIPVAAMAGGGAAGGVVGNAVGDTISSSEPQSAPTTTIINAQQTATVKAP